MFKEFKQFAMKGNVLDLAVGMIIGAAFTSIVKGLVDNILGPILGLITGGVNLTYMKIVLSGEGEAAVTMNIGLFIQSVINFILVAFSVFLLVKAIRSMEKKEEAKPVDPPAPPKSEILLEEIRDLLKK
ncbi:MAG: large conductance mechanosensitive channel protein MscL [Bdellovibrionales bacterium CG12_big_fil_rev_8_21_14_0_65_38_15]|nr:MAG: large conductance mechanosensitive channel protein MscL [Bdellovibrionales bacterium CG22_combo_CG10-13_8_21_14_all_38_13]PIQ53540.1 MAG: large conductance mechanosensitive channel protein MscL [Bdellovibrionales bacterium CG12_big_fil_rev_8_21_14_0_65_38_15]PIR28456.1 MAG: large conductance mechanosensitive channel protein MscL [Bdellovibrionales bacterium CG11_big_fil_rev_8_21_14_0_20_38_13]